VTTYPTSSAPAAKAWLYGQMQSTLTATSDATFGVRYASDVDNPNSPDDMVWLGSVVNRVVSRLAFVGNMGQDALQEEYDLQVVVSCYRAGEEGATVTTDQAPIAEARAWALAGAIETIARTDPTFGGAVITARPGESNCDVDWDESGNGRVADLTLSIHCFMTI